MVSLLASIAAGSGVVKLDFISHYSIFFSDDNPDLARWDDFQATYSKNDNVNFALQLPKGDAFDKQMAVIVETLTEKSWNLPNATRVDSISNFQMTTASEEGFEVEDLIEGAAELSQDTLDKRGQYAKNEPAIYKNIISEDLRTTAVNVTLDFPGLTDDELVDTVKASRALVAEMRAEFPDLTIVPTGAAFMNYAFVESGTSDGKTLVPLMYGIVLLLSLVLLRSFVGMFATLLTIILSTLVGLGIGGHLGMVLAPVTILAPNIILTLAVADCIHIISSVQKNLRGGIEKHEAIRLALRKNFLAVFVTSATTAVGFLTLNFSDAPPFHYLGNMSAIGVIAAWILAVTLVPALLAVMPLKAAAVPRKGILEGPMDALANFTINKRKIILPVGGLFSIVLTVLAFSNELDDRFSQYFGKEMQIRQDLDFASENLRGLDVYEYSVLSGSEGGIAEPRYMQQLDDFTSWLRDQPEVQHVASYADTIKRLNMNMNADNPEFYAIPDQRDLSAQYQFLYELSLPYGLDLNDRINLDKSSTRLTVSLHDLKVSKQQEFGVRAQAWIAANTDPEFEATETGISMIFGMMAIRNINAMIIGNIIAVLAISVMMMITLRSIGIGALSVVTNIIPVMVTFGFWAMTVGYIGLSASVIGAVSLGIVVDYSVHFLTKYLDAMRHLGKQRDDALRYAFAEVGEALVFTSLIVGVGFAILALSTFQINGQLGLLTAITVVVALVFDLLMLPGILLIGFRRQETSSTDATPSTDKSSTGVRTSAVPA